MIRISTQPLTLLHSARLQSWSGGSVALGPSQTMSFIENSDKTNIIGAQNATRHDRTWTDGRQHGAAPNQKRPPMRGLRPIARGDCGSGEGEGGWRIVAGRFSKETGEAPSRLADGAGCGCRQKYRRSPAVA